MSNRGRHRGSAKKGGARRAENNKIYGNPLPLLIEPRPSLQWTSGILGLFGFSVNRISKPTVEGYLDPATRSVWVNNTADAMLLWRRGFFGKGNLSRSEPSWLARQINQRKIKAAGGELKSYTYTASSTLTLCVQSCRNHCGRDHREAASRA